MHQVTILKSSGSASVRLSFRNSGPDCPVAPSQVAAARELQGFNVQRSTSINGQHPSTSTLSSKVDVNLVDLAALYCGFQIHALWRPPPDTQHWCKLYLAFHMLLRHQLTAWSQSAHDIVLSHLVPGRGQEQVGKVLTVEVTGVLKGA